MYTVHNTTIHVMTTETPVISHSFANKLFYSTTYLTVCLMDEENGLLSGSFVTKNTTPNSETVPLPVYFMPPCATSFIFMYKQDFLEWCRWGYP